MHQPLAALTPLLLFPLENRTSTHPPSTPVRPSRPSRPSSPPPPPLSVASCLSRIRAPVKYSGRHPRRLRHSRNSISVLCMCGWFSSSSSNARDLCYPLRSRRRSSSRCFRLSRFLLPFPPSPVSLLAPSSSSLLSCSLLRKRLVSSSSRFPSLPVLHPVYPPPLSHCRCRRRRCCRRRSSSFGVRTLSSSSHPLSVLLRPVCFTDAFSVRRTCTHTLQHSRTRGRTSFARLPLADYLFHEILLHPSLNPAHVLPSLPLAARLPRVLSLALVQRILPAPRWNLSLQEEPASTSYSADPPPTSPGSSSSSFSFGGLKVGEERASVPRRVSHELVGIRALMKSPSFALVSKSI